eukprot:CAMPEP_0171219294 /NCGR_PEP_ID=MMETSP0790-20130122/33641_1 /TAXON_ID=2925 /ORGANISM="Alexandrium catenella, Strain OF101" /LENGTH=476 /DNA_ID=CAMNT_0011685139 /DNA_START=1 /DNA_END=1428 /DNA_ORIENTATION=+
MAMASLGDADARVLYRRPTALQPWLRRRPSAEHGGEHVDGRLQLWRACPPACTPPCSSARCPRLGRVARLPLPLGAGQLWQGLDPAAVARRRSSLPVLVDGGQDRRASVTASNLPLAPAANGQLPLLLPLLLPQLLPQLLPVLSPRRSQGRGPGVLLSPAVRGAACRRGREGAPGGTGGVPARARAEAPAQPHAPAASRFLLVRCGGRRPLGATPSLVPAALRRLAQARTPRPGPRTPAAAALLRLPACWPSSTPPRLMAPSGTVPRALPPFPRSPAIVPPVLARWARALLYLPGRRRQPRGGYRGHPLLPQRGRGRRTLPAAVLPRGMALRRDDHGLLLAQLAATLPLALLVADALGAVVPRLLMRVGAALRALPGESPGGASSLPGLASFDSTTFFCHRFDWAVMGYKPSSCATSSGTGLAADEVACSEGGSAANAGGAGSSVAGLAVDEVARSDGGSAAIAGGPSSPGARAGG